MIRLDSDEGREAIVRTAVPRFEASLAATVAAGDVASGRALQSAAD
jgi:hypothetical protein